MKNNIPSSRSNKESYIKHVLGVRKYALELAKRLNADMFVVEIASLLHDVGASAGKDHAKESAKIAKNFLTENNLPENILTGIIKSIFTHSEGNISDSVEQKILREADGLSFLEDTYVEFFDQSEKMYETKDEAKNSYYKKLEKMKNKIITAWGINIADSLIIEARRYADR